MPAKRRYVGWRVLWMTLADRIDRPFCRAASESAAREVVERMNNVYPDRLYWAEYWNTDSFLNSDGGGHESEAGSAAVPEMR